ncbi:MAG TPA: outer membrane protein transport protein [Thermoanaerobaculia bacterium]|nr:outer membrane protein transport protein [Thermoanaerobaculia bacterium]
MRPLAFTVALLVAVPALATNGYFLHGIGTGSKAMAGATTAFPLEALDADTNPAAGVFVPRGYSFSLGFFSPDRQYTVTGSPSGYPQTFGLTPGTVASKSKLFPMPAFGYNVRPNDLSALTFNFTAHGGMNTDYRTSTFYGADHTGVDLAQMFFTATYSRKITPNQSFGISAVIAEQRFKASGLEAFAAFSSDPDCLTGNGYRWSHGAGVKLGYLAKPAPKLSIGAAYSPTIKMSKLGQYCGLFAQDGRFNIPGSLSAGIAYQISDPLTVTTDFQRIHYSDVASVGNTLLPNLLQAPLGSDGGPGFGWRDINVYKLGVQWKASDTWTWRAGLSKADQPIPSSEVLFNILAPGVVQEHITFGFSKATAPGRFNVAVMYAPPKTVRGPNPLEVPGGQSIALKMHETEIEFGYSFGF